MHNIPETDKQKSKEPLSYIRAVNTNQKLFKDFNDLSSVKCINILIGTKNLHQDPAHGT